ncbi:DUF4424 family protein [Alsobacter sp. SYSU BS001988]
MRKRIRHGLAMAATVWGLSVGQAAAAESVTELRLAALALPADETRIRLDAADIAIGPEAVVARYRLVNHSEAAVSVTLAFPMPNLDFSDPDVSLAIPGPDPLNFLGLTARIDGKPADVRFSQSAQLNGRDVTATLRQSGLALAPVGPFQAQLAAMPQPLRDKLTDGGVLAILGADVQGAPIYAPKWTVRTLATRRLAFAPGQAMDVEIRHRTSLGASPDTMLRNPLRDAPGLSAEVHRYKAEYCIDDAFFAALDRMTTAGDANVSGLRERRILYALEGAAAAGPIKDFRLVVDKGRPDRLVSFCLDNLKRISPTRFEMRATDYRPTRGLKVLLIERNG